MLVEATGLEKIVDAATFAYTRTLNAEAGAVNVTGYAATLTHTTPTKTATVTVTGGLAPYRFRWN